MEADVLELKEQVEQAKTNRLNAIVAVTIALLATFMGICKVKDDNIVQSMQQAQADKIDNWGYYQARNTQEKLMQATAAQFEIAALNYTGVARDQALKQGAFYRGETKRLAGEKADIKTKAQAAESDYDRQNYRDDQFDLCDAALAISISLLAVTALTHQRWLYFVSLVPTFFGVLMGLSGLLSWKFHPDFLTKLLS